MKQEIPLTKIVAKRVSTQLLLKKVINDDTLLFDCVKFENSYAIIFERYCWTYLLFHHDVSTATLYVTNGDCLNKVLNVSTFNSSHEYCCIDSSLFRKYIFHHRHIFNFVIVKELK